MDIREILVHLRAGRSDRQISRDVGLDRRTVKRYRDWAVAQGLLTGGIPPIEKLQALLDASAGPDWRLRLTLDVAPKEHYERVYQDMLSRQGHLLRPETVKLLRQALTEARASRYRALSQDYPLSAISAPVAN